MQTAKPLLQEDEAKEVTLLTHRQAVESTIRMMHTHLSETLTLEDLAATAYLSPYYFNRIFRRLIGIPPIEFLAALRFQMARNLLITTSLSVIDICFEVGYASPGSFTSRFTRSVGLAPRFLRQKAHEFEPIPIQQREQHIPEEGYKQIKHTLRGRISAPSAFRGTIYVGLFSSPIPQGAPIHCTRLGGVGFYQMNNVMDGVYYLRAAAFPEASDLQAYLLPGENMLFGNTMDALIVRNGYIFGAPDLLLHGPRLTDPPLVIGLPLL